MNESDTVNTGGGAMIQGNVTPGADFVGRDQITNINLTADPVTLSFLVDFLKAALPKPLARSTQTAQALAFALYEQLGDVANKTDIFVTALMAMTQLASSSTPTQLAMAQQHLQTAAQALMAALPLLARALDQVNPQLEIQQYALVQQIEAYQQSRARVLTDLEAQVASLPDQAPALLQPLLHHAEQNRALIQQALQQLRVFLAAEFPFKASFSDQA